jgi:hypothetical protein
MHWHKGVSYDAVFAARSGKAHRKPVIFDANIAAGEQEQRGPGRCALAGGRNQATEKNPSRVVAAAGKPPRP